MILHIYTGNAHKSYTLPLQAPTRGSAGRRERQRAHQADEEEEEGLGIQRRAGVERVVQI